MLILKNKQVWTSQLVFFLFAIVLSIYPTNSKAAFLEFMLKDQFQNPIDDAVVILSDPLEDKAGVSQATMDQKNKAFSPRVLTIDQNTLVSFPNSDNIRHHVYSFSKAKQFEIKLYADTPEQPILFDQPGVVVLGCNIHDSMIGYIFVSQWKYYTSTNSQGVAQLPYDDEPPEEILIWHPRLSEPALPIKVGGVNWSNRKTFIELDLKPDPPKKKSRFR